MYESSKENLESTNEFQFTNEEILKELQSMGITNVNKQMCDMIKNEISELTWKNETMSEEQTSTYMNDATSTKSTITKASRVNSSSMETLILNDLNTTSSTIKRKVYRTDKNTGRRLVCDELLLSCKGDTIELGELELRLDNLSRNLKKSQNTKRSLPCTTCVRRLDLSRNKKTSVLKCNQTTYKKSDPVSLYHAYKTLWKSQKIPVDTQHKVLRWNMRAQMIHHDAIVGNVVHNIFDDFYMHLNNREYQGPILNDRMMSDAVAQPIGNVQESKRSNVYDGHLTRSSENVLQTSGNQYLPISHNSIQKEKLYNFKNDKFFEPTSFDAHWHGLFDDFKMGDITNNLFELENDNLSVKMPGNLNDKISRISKVSPLQNSPGQIRRVNKIDNSKAFFKSVSPPKIFKTQQQHINYKETLFLKDEYQVDKITKSNRLANIDKKDVIVISNVSSLQEILSNKCRLIIPKDKKNVYKLSREEELTMMSEGYPIPDERYLTRQDEKNIKKVRRKIKNKLSAQESRRKKKEYIESLEKKLNFVYNNVLLFRMEDYRINHMEMVQLLEKAHDRNSFLREQIDKINEILIDFVNNKNLDTADVTQNCLELISSCKH
ncbi:Cyclic AMP-responsive element-binding protein 3-like protein 3-A [Intoshia linei]|uniref:Cyclic AMP-responsive element-binding protein 3-like protein 3-A n=1 Tax=Intoshia linei TaxID=1819745 RepID=A0A177B9B7_9BILA|nr:Cyclic AMP-responsive element-binding protein 3-like protein 3-A [Intoshia linei]